MMITNKNLLTILIAATLSFAPTSLMAKQKFKNADMLDQIDKDFSRFPFDMKEEDARKLKIDGVTYNEDDFGELVDEAGIIHSFYDGLYGKKLIVNPAVPAKPIKILNIGLAREQKDVLAAFGKYSAGQVMECDAMSKENLQANPEWASRTYSCNFSFDPANYDARMVLSFDTNRQLTEIFVMAWNPF
jgi:hypothetical protein